jgi:hypothetical protein
VILHFNLFLFFYLDLSESQYYEWVIFHFKHFSFFLSTTSPSGLSTIRRFIPLSAHNDWSQCHFNNEWRYCFIIGMFIDGCDWFRKLRSVWLTIIIWHNSSSFHRLYGKTLMFILLSYQTGFNPQYMFMQTTVFFCHGKNMDNGIKVFKLILNEFYTYLIGWNNKISKNYSLFSRLIHILMVINYFVIYSNSYM